MSREKILNQEKLSKSEVEILTTEKRLVAVVKSHTTMIKVTLSFALIALLCVATLFVVVAKTRSHNFYFASTSDGRIVHLTPMNQPMLSLQAVESFTSRAIGDTFTFDYANYKNQITGNAQYYTPKAFKEIIDELQGSNGIVSEAINNNWVVTTNVTAAPQVVKQGVIGNSGIYGWRLIYPVMITFQNAKDTSSSRYTADVIVTRVKQKEYPSGIAIKRLTLTPYRY